MTNHLAPTTQEVTVHKAVRAMTPAEIDTILADISIKRAQNNAWLNGALDSIEKETKRYMDRGQEPSTTGVSRIGQLTVHADKYRAELAELAEFAAPYEAEFKRRGGWLRYFLVTNGNGHVHRGMDCSTCFATTEFAWLIDLADCDEDKMVEEYGEMACTVCFPDAPVHPAWAQSVAEREAAEAKKAASRCAGSGTIVSQGDDVDGSMRLYRPWARCPVCGEGVSVTSTYKFRSHKKADVEAAS